MIDVREVYDRFRDEGISFFAGVPDSLLKAFCGYLDENAPAGTHVIAANEGNAVALAAGHYLATGQHALVYMQNSGLGNAINPLLSLADPAVYAIPILLMIGWRGEPGMRDEPQHIKQGKVTLELLEAMEIPYVILDEASWQHGDPIAYACSLMRGKGGPAAVVVRTGVFAPYKSVGRKTEQGLPYDLTREEALKVVVDQLHPTDIVVATTGKTARELFEYREQTGRTHARDFLTVGSMGHASQIALAVAMRHERRNVFCFDGDGSLIMHAGGLAVIGQLSPKNYRHILFNNGAHDSVGGQPTAGFDIDFCKLASAYGYRYARKVHQSTDIVTAMQELKAVQGPAMLEIRLTRGARGDLGRPTLSPIENRDALMKELVG